ncbi:hypothetical protein QN277_021975 [Acacia crassicarpa]|uniref:Ammonium transporter AmtB-like domain-containing protein n=1 Tax=Acacia crassicarpa TaxID=499986 RepID=A0AAE1JQ30_9FABA|nr:hypothetical protein QN277_021975 [Acacia crassicarpa]
MEEGGGRRHGLLMGGGGRLVAVQVVLCRLVTTTTGPLFYVLNKMKLSRISSEDEMARMDLTRHGSFTYAYHNEDESMRHSGFMMGKIEPANSLATTPTL